MFLFRTSHISLRWSVLCRIKLQRPLKKSIETKIHFFQMYYAFLSTLKDKEIEFEKSNKTTNKEETFLTYFHT